MNLNELFNIIVVSSAMGSIVCVIILLLKAVFKHKFSVSWHYYIWLILIIRLAMPFTPESPFSVFNLVRPVTQRAEVPQEITYPNQGYGTVPDTGTIPAKDSPPVFLPEANPGTDSGITQLPQQESRHKAMSLSAGWLLGAALTALFLLSLNFRLLLSLRKQREYHHSEVLQILEECKQKMKITSTIRVISNPTVKTPALFGLIKPRILVPERLLNKLSADEIRHMFLHELVHFKRKDNLLNAIMLILQTLHWFNPILWYAYFRMREDCEIACDAYVLSYLHPAEHRQYAETIVNMAKEISMGRWLPGAVGMAKNQNSIKRRITMLTGFRKIPLLWSVLALGLALITGMVVLTNSVGSPGNNKTFLLLRSEVESIRISSAVLESRELTAAEIDVFLGWFNNITDFDQANDWSGTTGSSIAIQTKPAEKGFLILNWEFTEGYIHLQRDSDENYRAKSTEIRYLLELLDRGVLPPDITDLTVGHPAISDINFPPSFNELIVIAEAHGFSHGVILSLTDRAELLLCHSQINAKDDLVVKRIVIDQNNQVLYERDMYFPENLLGYTLTFKYYDASSMNYLLGYRSLINEADKKIYSDLLVIEKDYSSAMDVRILQSYSLAYDAATGMVPQGDIPAVIDFSLELIGDYLVFQDVDSFWKVQDIKTAEIYNSGEENTSLSEVELIYMPSGQYIYILQYVEDKSVLIFDTTSHEFILETPRDWIPIEAYRLRDIESANFYDIYEDKVIIDLSAEKIIAVQTAFNDAFDTIEEHNWEPGNGWSPGVALIINVSGKQRVSIVKAPGEEQFLVSYMDILEEGGYERAYNITEYEIQSAKLREIFDNMQAQAF